MVWLLIGLALAVVAVGAAVTKLPVPAVISSVVAAVGAMVAAVSTTRAVAVLKNRDDHLDTRHGLLRCDRRGGLPLVRGLNDPVQLGVHPAALVESLERSPGFVRRDVMERLTSAISKDRFVLLVGESTAGKSRAAYEAVRELFPGHRLVEPSQRDAAKTAVDAMLESPRAVLWLDDIERFLGAGGFTGAGISGILSTKHCVIVATMRSEEYAYFCGGSSSTIDATRSRETIRQGWEVLRLATRIDLPRSWSTDEVVKARRLEPRDPRIAEALEQVDRFGVAEYLAAGPQLLATWRDAWAPGTHPRAAALVHAAIDARRAGVHRPLSIEVLTLAHESYLRRRGGHRLRPEELDRAIEWATTPLHATSSLLIPSGDGGFTAFDYLIDAVERESIPADALEAFIDAGQPEELKDIGQVAWNWGRLCQAELAYERASETYVESRTNRGYVIEERDGRAAQRLFLQESLEELSAKLGWNHQDTVTIRSALFWVVGGGPRPSLRGLLDLRAETEQALGAFHPVILNIRRGIAHWTGETGETHEAACQYLRLLEDCLKHLDETEWITYAAMFGYAKAVGRGGAERAVELHDEFAAWMRARRAPADTLTTLRYQRADQLRRAGRFSQALDELESIAKDEERRHGRLNGQTLNALTDLFACMADSGDALSALELAQDLLEECRASAESQCIDLRHLRLTISTMTGETGDTTEALLILKELKEEHVHRIGEDDPFVRSVDYRSRYWTAVEKAHAGRLSDAADDLRRLGEDITIFQGANRPLSELVLRRLEEVTSQLRG
ncbi:hypothetical protein [Amycolatopsis sp. cmx-11-12]|uniref:hypothetical protein n=1 Tax=Amycolatopsis sp. cmx-11-12 TaxID=2785795 RepID=UPI00391736AD